MTRGISIHIGINNVDAAVYGSPLTLRACENDARAMWALATAAGFDMDHSKLLLSRDATSRAVSDAITAAADMLDSGDILFCTYSGHGGQVPDPSGEEPDAKDETWVLFDRQLIDDELLALWARFPQAARIFVLSDSCHSGTVVKDFDDTYYDGTRRATLNALPILVRDLVGLDDIQPLTKDLPFDVQAEVYQANKSLYDGLPRVREASLAVPASVVLISGCQDNQLSLDGTVNGLFTEKLLAVWQNGAFQGAYESLHEAIVRLMPPTQTPNLYTTGTPSPPFLRQRPLTIASPVPVAAPTPQGTSFMDQLQALFGNRSKGIGMTATDTMPAQEKWVQFIPFAIDVGMQVFDVLTKEGFEVQDPAGHKVAATKDLEGGEKWVQFIPMAIDLGLQVYDALSKEGALPADKQVPMPKDFSADSMKGWLDLLPIAIDLGTDVFNALAKEGYVSPGANLPTTPQLNDPAAKGWLDLIPVALSTGGMIIDALTKQTGQIPAGVSKGMNVPASTTKQFVDSFSDQLLKK
jgi:hypothetical protein